MRWMFALLVAVAMFRAVPASAQDAAVYVATYIEAAPEAAKRAAAMLKAEAAASRRDEGCRSIQALAENGRDSRFVLLEVWSDQSAFAAHRDSDHARQFLRQLGSVQAAPPDERVGEGLWIGLAPKAAPTQALWVVTHVDVPPPSKDDASAMLKRLGEESAREPGNLRFDIAQQTSRPNHFTVSEIWRGRGAFEAHQTAAHTRQFRDQLGPLLGALYDQRIYRKLN
jgi:quinol monooxygenase YgiN